MLKSIMVKTYAGCVVNAVAMAQLSSAATLFPAHFSNRDCGLKLQDVPVPSKICSSRKNMDSS